MAAAAPSFSYAEAAKGRSPSLVAEAPAKPENSGSVADLTLPAKTPKAQENLSGSTESLKAPSIGDQEVSSSEAVKSTMDAQQSDPVANMPLPQDETASADTKEQGSTPISNSGTLPAAPKDTAGTTTPNDSESGWDKVSQLSQNDEKRSAKGDGWDVDDTKASAWEEESVSAGLKDAPPPAVNVWQKRAADAQAKAKDPRTVSGALSPAAEPPLNKKPTEVSGEAAKSKAKPKEDEKVGLGISKGPSKQSDGKPRVEEGMLITRAEVITRHCAHLENLMIT